MAKVGIVGTGWGVRAQVPGFREAGLEVVAIAGAHRNKTKRIAEELGLIAHDEWASLVVSKDVDLVSVVAPPAEHAKIAVAALAAGKHVLCEKPTALNIGEAELMLSEAKKHPRQLALIDHELRFLPSFRTARERLHELGAIRYVEVRYASPSRGDRRREWNWWSDASRGGGIWGAVGSHYVDAIRYLIGEIEAVQATLSTVVRERTFGEATREVTSDDLAFVTMRVRGGALAMLSFSAVAAGPDEPTTMTIHGENGAMRLVGEELLVAMTGEPFTRAAGGPLDPRPGNTAGGAFATATIHLGRAIKAALDDGDRAALAPAATFDDGLAQQRVLDAAREASRKAIWAIV